MKIFLNVGDVDSDDENVDEDGLPIAAEGPSKIGKKKAEKMQAKAEKKLEREAMQKELEEKKKQREKDDEEARYYDLFNYRESSIYVTLISVTRADVCREISDGYRIVSISVTCYWSSIWALFCLDIEDCLNAI